MGNSISHTQPSAKAVFHKVGPNLYRLKSSGTYYGLFKRSGKQIRRSLKTTDGALARRRLFRTITLRRMYQQGWTLNS